MIKQLEKRVAALEAAAGLTAGDCEPFQVFDQEGHLLFLGTFSNGGAEATKSRSAE
jgi:hypothetical protein